MKYELLIPGFKYKIDSKKNKEFVVKKLFQIYYEKNKLKINKKYIFGLKYNQKTSYFFGQTIIYPYSENISVYNSKITIQVNKKKSIISKYPKYNLLKYLFLAEKKGILKNIPKDIIYLISLFIC